MSLVCVDGGRSLLSFKNSVRHLPAVGLVSFVCRVREENRSDSRPKIIAERNIQNCSVLAFYSAPVRFRQKM